MAEWTDAELAELDGDEVVLVIPWDAAGTLRRVPVWSVAVGGQLWLRSWKGTGAGWHRRVTANPDAAIELDGVDVPVRYELVADPDTQSPREAIDAGYRRKYGSTPYLAPMLESTAVEATVRVVKR